MAVAREGASLRGAQIFTRADALQALIIGRVDLPGLVRQKPEFFEQAEAEFHVRLLSGRDWLGVV